HLRLPGPLIANLSNLTLPVALPISSRPSGSPPPWPARQDRRGPTLPPEASGTARPSADTPRRSPGPDPAGSTLDTKRRAHPTVPDLPRRRSAVDPHTYVRPGRCLLRGSLPRKSRRRRPRRRWSRRRADGSDRELDEPV